MEQTELDVAQVIDNFNKIQDHVTGMSGHLKTISAMVKWQEKMIDLLMDTMLKIVDDQSVEFRIRRKVMFTLQQIKGFASEAQVEIKELI